MAKPVTTNSVTDVQIVWQTASPANLALNPPIATAITLPSPTRLLRAPSVAKGLVSSGVS
jgi:hypothetical protein